MQGTIVFVNGYYSNWRSGVTGWLARNYIGQHGGRKYWTDAFINRAIRVFGNNEFDPVFVDGCCGVWSNAAHRLKRGYLFIKKELNNSWKDPLVFISHSQGAAFAEGMIRHIKEEEVEIRQVLHFSPSQPTQFSAHIRDISYQLVYRNDILSSPKPIGNIYRMGVAAVNGQQPMNEVRYNHARSKLDPDSVDVMCALVNNSSIDDLYQTRFIKEL